MKAQGDRANGMIVPAELQKDSEKHFIVEHGEITVLPKVDLSMYERVIGRVTVVNPRNPAQTKTFARELLIPKIEVIDPDTGTPTEVVDTGSMDGSDIEITYTDENGDEVTVVIPGHKQEDGGIPPEVKRVLVYRSDIEGDYAVYNETFYWFTLSELIAEASAMVVRDQATVDAAMSYCIASGFPVAVRTNAVLSASNGITIAFLDASEVVSQYYAASWNFVSTKIIAKIASDATALVLMSGSSCAFSANGWVIDDAMAILGYFLAASIGASDNRTTSLSTTLGTFSVSQSSMSIGFGFLGDDVDSAFLSSWDTSKLYAEKYPQSQLGYFGVVVNGKFMIDITSATHLSKVFSIELIESALSAGIFDGGMYGGGSVVGQSGVNAMIVLGSNIEARGTYYPTFISTDYTTSNAFFKYYETSSFGTKRVWIKIQDTICGTKDEAKTFVEAIFKMIGPGPFGSAFLQFGGEEYDSHRFYDDGYFAGVKLSYSDFMEYNDCVFQKVSDRIGEEPVRWEVYATGSAGVETYYFSDGIFSAVHGDYLERVYFTANSIAGPFYTVHNGVTYQHFSGVATDREAYYSLENTITHGSEFYFKFVQIGGVKVLNDIGIMSEHFDYHKINYYQDGKPLAIVYDGANFTIDILQTQSREDAYKRYFEDSDNPHDILATYMMPTSDMKLMIADSLSANGSFLNGGRPMSAGDFTKAVFRGEQYTLSNLKFQALLLRYYNLLAPVIAHFSTQQLHIFPTSSASAPYIKSGEPLYTAIPNPEMMLYSLTKEYMNKESVFYNSDFSFRWPIAGGSEMILQSLCPEGDYGSFYASDPAYYPAQNEWVSAVFVEGPPPYEIVDGLVVTINPSESSVDIKTGGFIANEVVEPAPALPPEPAPETADYVVITDVSISGGVVDVSYAFEDIDGIPVPPPQYVDYINATPESDINSTVIPITPISNPPVPSSHDAGQYVITSLGMGSIRIVPKDNTGIATVSFGISGSRFVISIADIINSTLPLPMRQILRDDTGIRSTYIFGLFDELQYSLPRCVETYTGTTWAQTADGVKYQEHTGYRKLVQAAADITGWRYKAAYAMNSSIGYFFVPNSIEEINLSLDYWLSPIAFVIQTIGGKYEKSVVVLGQTGDVAMIFCTSSDSGIAATANEIAAKVNAAISGFISANDLRMADGSAARAVEISLRQSMANCTIAVRFSNGKVAVSSQFKVWHNSVESITLNATGATRAIRLEGLTPIEAMPVFSVGDNGQIAYGTPPKEVGATMPQFKNGNATANSDLAKITYGGKVVFVGGGGSGGGGKWNKRTVVSGMQCSSNPAFSVALSSKRFTSFFDGSSGNFQSEPRTQVNASITVAEGKISTPLSSFTLATNPVIQLSNTPLVPMTEKQKWVYEHADDPIDTAGVRVSRVFSIPSRISHCNGWAVISEVYSTSGGRKNLSPSGAASSEAPVPIPNPLTCSCPDGNCIEYDYAPAIN